MEKKTEETVNKTMATQSEKVVELEGQTPKKKASKTWEAMMRLKGSLIVNDPNFLL